MRIGFDAKRYFHNQTGLGNYSRSLVNSLVETAPAHSYFLFDSKGGYESTVLPTSARLVKPKSAQFLWRQIGISNQIEQLGLDVYHGLSAELPLSRPRNIKQVVTIHDLIFIKYASFYSWFDRLIYTYKIRQSVSTASIVICPSEVTKNDLIDIFKVPEEKIKVIYVSCGKEFVPPDSEGVKRSFREQHRLPEQYMLCVSKFEERKNHIRLLHAWKSLLPEQKLPLVLVGRKGNSYDKIKSWILKHAKNDILLLTDIAKDDLPGYYQAANWTIFPSQYEGFGIPVLESISCRTPVLMPVGSPMAEYSGQTEGLFNPTDVTSMAQCISQSMKTEFRESTRRNLDETALLFAPQTIAAQHLKLYESLL